MGFFNIIITMCVGAVLLFGAALTYKHRMAEREMEMAQNPMAAVVGRRAVMEQAARMFISSTYWSDTIGLRAALTTLREVRRRVPGALTLPQFDVLAQLHRSQDGMTPGMLTRALLHFGDRIAWLALLRAPWAGVELADLLVLARAHPLIWDALQDEALLHGLDHAAQVRCLRLRDTLLAALRVRNETSLARWVERTWLCLGGASCLAHASDLHLADTVFARLRDLEQRGLPDVAVLQDSFADLFADSGTDGSVQIMTIHRAKGLEFDFVVMPALNRIRISRRSLVLVW